MKIVLLALTMAIAQTAPGPDSNGPFCERMASQLNLKPVFKGSGPPIEWRADTASLGKYLFGGSLTTAFQIEPSDMEATPAEMRRVRELCQGTKKGAECRVEGGVRLRLTTARGQSDVTARDGERAIAGLRGSTVFCRPA